LHLEEVTSTCKRFSLKNEHIIRISMSTIVMCKNSLNHLHCNIVAKPLVLDPSTCAIVVLACHPRNIKRKLDPKVPLKETKSKPLHAPYFQGSLTRRLHNHGQAHNLHNCIWSTAKYVDFSTSPPTQNVYMWRDFLFDLLQYFSAKLLVLCGLHRNTFFLEQCLVSTVSYK
jgi:hypothetical protein